MSLLLVSVVVCAPAFSQVKKVRAPYTSPASGQGMFASYCASCHGKDGKGSGPAASALKQPPTDLTQLTAKNGGKYPGDHVAAVITGKAEVVSHGSKDMPVWGPVFWKMSGGHTSDLQQRVSNLVSYIQSIQAK